MQWLTQNWATITAVAGALYTLLSIINGLIQNPEAKSLIGKVIDGLSFLSRAAAPGTVKAPGTLSKASDAPSSPPDASMRALLPVLLLASLGMSACAGAKAWLGCTLGQIPQAAQPAFPAIYQALTDQDENAAVAALETIASNMLAGQVPCIVTAIKVDEEAKAQQVKGMRSRASVAIMRNAGAYLAKHPATACGDPPLPPLPRPAMISCVESPGIREITCRDEQGNEVSFAATFRPIEGDGRKTFALVLR